MRVFQYGILGVIFFLLFAQSAPEGRAFSRYLSNSLLAHNMHVVGKGDLLRAAQMTPEALKSVIAEHSIKTVIDLRMDGGEGSEEPVVKSAGALYLNMPILGKKVPNREEVRRLIEVFDAVERPVLVHCSSGSHRSGLASAIWLLTQEQGDVKQAADQLSPSFGVVPWERTLRSLIVGEETSDNLIWDYERETRSAPMPFRKWNTERECEEGCIPQISRVQGDTFQIIRAEKKRLKKKRAQERRLRKKEKKEKKKRERINSEGRVLGRSTLPESETNVPVAGVQAAK